MANTTYKSLVPITALNRKMAYIRLCDLLLHLDNLNLNVVSITRDGSNFVIIVLNNPLPLDQLDHLSVELV